MNSPNSPGAVTRPSARTSMRPTSGHRCSVPRSHSLAHATVSLMPYVWRTGHPNAAAIVSRCHSGNCSALVIATRIVTSPRPRRRTSRAKAYNAEG